MKSMLTIFLLLLASIAYASAQTSQKSFVGCFNRQPDGLVQFGATPSGDLFAIKGDTKLAEEHVNQLVRVSGDVDQTSHNPNGNATLTISSVEVLAGSCTAESPAANAAGIPGKVGEDYIAVPLTDTSTEGETTPGAQIDTTDGHPDASHRSEHPGAAPEAAPLHPEQFGQSQAAADVNASAVERTEILPDHTLGVAGESPDESAMSPK